MWEEEEEEYLAEGLQGTTENVGRLQRQQQQETAPGARTAVEALVQSANAVLSGLAAFAPATSNPTQYLNACTDPQVLQQQLAAMAAAAQVAQQALAVAVGSSKSTERAWSKDDNNCLPSRSVINIQAVAGPAVAALPLDTLSNCQAILNKSPEEEGFREVQ